MASHDSLNESEKKKNKRRSQTIFVGFFSKLTFRLFYLILQDGVLASQTNKARLKDKIQQKDNHFNKNFKITYCSDGK